jgi:hypothetical protein
MPRVLTDDTKATCGYETLLKTARQKLLLRLAILAVALQGGSLCAQEPASDQTTTDRETIHQLVQQVKQLQDKVAALEAKQGTVPVPPAAVDAKPALPPADAADNGGDQTAAFEESHDIRGIRWRGFGEVNYKVLDQRQPALGTFGFVPGSAGNFYSGDFDLFLTSKLTDKASVLAEAVIRRRRRTELYRGFGACSF